MTRRDQLLRQSFQDDAFEVAYAEGDVIETLLGFAKSPECPQKLLIRFRESGWCSLYLSAFIAHWDALVETELVELHQDYEGIPLVDYGNRFELDGSRVRSIVCRSAASAAYVVLDLEVGTLRFYAVDPPDPHSESALAWRPMTSDRSPPP